MDRLLKMMRKLAKKHKENWVLKKQYVDIKLVRRGRHQRVYMSLEDGFYSFYSVVMGSTAVKKNYQRWNELTVMAWERNSNHELVTFAFDKYDRLIGHIRHPAEYLDIEELELYISNLSFECDRFEFLISGEDRF
jgi:hypothetical protein